MISVIRNYSTPDIPYDDEQLQQLLRRSQGPNAFPILAALRAMASAEGNPITSAPWIPTRITLADLSPIPSAFAAIQTSIEGTQWTRQTQPAQRAVQISIVPPTRTYVFSREYSFNPHTVREARFALTTAHVGEVIRGRNFSLANEVGPGRYEAIALPEPMLRNIAGFLRENPNNFGWVCYDFVNIAYGKKLTGTVFNPREWDLQPMDPTRLVPGTAIALVEYGNAPLRERVPHVALYLGPDQYLSKFGFTDIFVCTLAEMQKIYKSYEVQIMIPVDPAEKEEHGS